MLQSQEKGLLEIKKEGSSEGDDEGSNWRDVESSDERELFLKFTRFKFGLFWKEKWWTPVMTFPSKLISSILLGRELTKILDKIFLEASNHFKDKTLLKSK